MKFQLSDPEVWPEVPDGESTFIHRLAVRRAYAGGVVSSALLEWAQSQTRELRCSYLRLDCDAHRPKLRNFYIAHGFTYHSDFQFGPYLLARFEKRLGCADSDRGD